MDKLNDNRQFFDCACLSEEHTLRFDLWDWTPEPPELYLSVFLNQWRPWYGRLWVAIKYLFGYKCRYGHWDNTIIRVEDAPRLQQLLGRYVELYSAASRGCTCKIAVEKNPECPSHGEKQGDPREEGNLREAVQCTCEGDGCDGCCALRKIPAFAHKEKQDA